MDEIIGVVILIVLGLLALAAFVLPTWLLGASLLTDGQVHRNLNEVPAIAAFFFGLLGVGVGAFWIFLLTGLVRVSWGVWSGTSY